MKFFLRLVAAVVVLAILAGAGYAGYWYLAAGKTREAIEAWAASNTTDPAVRIGAVTVSGFPNRVVAVIDSIEVSRPGGSLPWQYKAENVRLARALSGTTTTINVLGPQTLTYTAGGQQQVARATAGLFALELRSDDDGKFTGFGLAVGDLKMDRPNAPQLSAKRVNIQFGQGSGLPGVLNDRSRMTFRFDGLTLPEHRRGALGDTLDQLSFNAQLTQPLKNLDLPVSLAQWRDAGGYVTFTDVVVKWGTLDLVSFGSGVLRLDEQYRPKGGMNAGVANYLQAIDAFHAARKLSEEARAAANAAVNFLGQRAATTGRIGLMMDIDNGNVAVGPATLGTVGPVLPGVAAPG